MPVCSIPPLTTATPLSTHRPWPRHAGGRRSILASTRALGVSAHIHTPAHDRLALDAGDHRRSRQHTPAHRPASRRIRHPGAQVLDRRGASNRRTSAAALTVIRRLWMFRVGCADASPGWDSESALDNTRATGTRNARKWAAGRASGTPTQALQEPSRLLPLASRLSPVPPRSPPRIHTFRLSHHSQAKTAQTSNSAASTRFLPPSDSHRPQQHSEWDRRPARLTRTKCPSTSSISPPPPTVSGMVETVVGSGLRGTGIGVGGVAYIGMDSGMVGMRGRDGSMGMGRRARPRGCEPAGVACRVHRARAILGGFSAFTGGTSVRNARLGVSPKDVIPVPPNGAVIQKSAASESPPGLRTVPRALLDTDAIVQCSYLLRPALAVSHITKSWASQTCLTL
ncbi:hypothetical protein AcV7_001914 [Taiwanofungus camphoratus]|nr:hypothetical protein AcV7_001914 [Antrodia cinnamomea]